MDLFFFAAKCALASATTSANLARAYIQTDCMVPIDFYVTFDEFFTVGKCRLASRYRDDISVVFEQWVDAPDLHEMFPLLRGQCSDDPI